MVERVRSKRRIMKEFEISELSAVDRPAQAPALITLLKRADDVEKKYKVIADLPKAVRDALPTKAQQQFLAVFNSVKDKQGTDQSAFQQAWGALGNAGWAKNKDGKWVKKSAEEIEADIEAAVLGKAAATQTNAGTKFLASDFAYVPDSSKPSTWKLRLTASPGGAPDPAYVGAAAAALSPGGHRGKKVQLPSSAVAGVKAKVRAAWRKANPDKKPDEMPQSIKKDYGDDSSYPQAVVAVNQEVQAVDFDTVLAEQEAREAAQEVGEDLREKWCALQRAFSTIAADETVSAADKITQMQQSLQQYIDSLSEQSQEIADSMTKSLTEAAPSLADLLQKSEEGDDDMPADVKKQLDELQKSVADITEKLAAATEANETKKASALQKSLDEAEAKIAELEKAASDDTVAELAKKAGVELSKDAPVADQVAELLAKASMSDAEKAYMSGLSGKAKMDFMTASKADRAKMMSKAVDDDPVVYKAADGTEFRKSDDPRLAKMAEKNDELAKQAAEEIEKRLVAEFEKKADEEPYKVLKGDAAARGSALRAISEIGDDGVRKTITDWVETCGKLMAKDFKTVGHNQEVDKSAADFEKKVGEIAARDKISKAKAMTKARTEHPDLFEAYQAAGSAN